MPWCVLCATLHPESLVFYMRGNNAMSVIQIAIAIARSTFPPTLVPPIPIYAPNGERQPV